MKRCLWKIGILDVPEKSLECLVFDKEYHVVADKLEEAIRIFRNQLNPELFISFIEKEGEVYLDD